MSRVFLSITFAALTFLTLSLSCFGANMSQSAVAVNKYRLGSQVLPRHYLITITPNLTDFTFTGEETILIEVVEPTKNIVMNAATLSVSNASVTATQTHEALAAQIETDKNLERITLALPQTLTPGLYRVKVTFSGVINNENRGFYRSKYKDKDGSEHPVAITIMEPTDARRMFPCFDEPNFKASFKIKAVIDPNLQAISNGEIQQEHFDPALNKKVVEFGNTPSMSTYLVGLFVGNFVRGKHAEVNGVPVTIWAPPDREELESFTLDTTVKLMNYYNDYFGINYPFKKLDLIAVPESEDDGMENLAAIAYQESAILINEKTASIETKKDVARLLAHELAHMWFGDLVTMKWWHDLWLKESFADWISYKAVDALMPDVKAWDIFAYDKAQTVFTDCLKSTRAIHFSVNNPGEITNMFDEITYMKGASVLRMMERYLGEQEFRQGVHNFLYKFKFDNAEAEDLWDAFSDVSQKPVGKIMSTWINQAGIPLVSVRQANGKATFNQERCLLDPGPQADNSLWAIPLKNKILSASSTSDQQQVKVELLNARESSSKLGSGEMVATANTDGSGYYRVRYDKDFITKLPGAIATLTGAERFALLNDQWYLLLAGKITKDEYLTVLKALIHDIDPLVVSEEIRQIWYWRSFNNGGNTGNGGIHINIQEQLASAFAKYGWQITDNESQFETMARASVIETLGTIGEDQAVIAKARSLYPQVANSNVEPSLAKAIVNIVAFNGDTNDYETIKSAWQKTDDPEDKQKYLFALAWFQQPELIQQSLALSLTPDVRIEEAANYVALIMRNAPDRDPVWQFTKQNWQALCQRCTRRLVVPVINGLGLLSTKEEMQDITTFFHEHPQPEIQADMDRTLERVAARVKFAQQ